MNSDSEERNYMANAEAEGEKAFCPPAPHLMMLARALAACRDEQFFGMKLRAPLYATRRARDRPPPTSSRIASGGGEREGEYLILLLSLSDNANEQVGVRRNSCGEHTIHSLLLSMVRVPTKGCRHAAKGELLITLM